MYLTPLVSCASWGVGSQLEPTAVMTLSTVRMFNGDAMRILTACMCARGFHADRACSIE